MSPKSAKLAKRILLVAGAAAAVACGSAPEGERTGTTSAKIIEDEAGYFGQTQLTGALSYVQFYASTLAFANQTIVFTPSSQLSGILYGDPNAGNHTTSFSIPSISYHPNVPLAPTFTGALTAFSASPANVSFSFAANELDVTAQASGTIHVSNDSVGNIVPSADLVIDNATVTAAITFNPTTQLLSATVSADIQDHVSNCGLAGWCNSIVQGMLPNFDSLVAQQVQPPLNGAIGTAQVTAGLYSIFTESWNLAHQNDTGGTLPWAITPYSLTYANSQFNFGVTRLGPPESPTTCVATPNTCGGAVNFECGIVYTDEVYYETLIGGTWVAGPQLENNDATTIPNMAAGTYTVRFCSTNSLATVCAPQQTFSPNTQACSSGGAGGSCTSVCASCTKTGGTCSHTSATTCFCVHE